MAPTPRTGLLGRLDNLFTTAHKLADLLDSEARIFRESQLNPSHYLSNSRPVFKDLYTQILECREAITNPPESLNSFSTFYIRFLRAIRTINAVLMRPEADIDPNFDCYSHPIKYLATLCEETIQNLTAEIPDLDPFAFIKIGEFRIENESAQFFDGVSKEISNDQKIGSENNSQNAKSEEIAHEELFIQNEFPIPPFPRPSEKRINESKCAMKRIEEFIPHGHVVRLSFYIRFLLLKGFTPAEATWSIFDAVSQNQLAWEEFYYGSPPYDNFISEDNAPAGIELAQGPIRISGERDSWSNILICVGSIKTPTSESESATSRQNKSPDIKKPRRRGKKEFLLPFLNEHHKYDGGTILNLEPIGNNALALKAGVSNSTASDFFEKCFKGHGTYSRLCQNLKTLEFHLQRINGDLPPELLLNHPEDLND